MKFDTELARRVLIYGTALISVMGVAITLPVLPFMAEALQLTDTMLGVLIYSFTLPGIIFAPICGILSDRWGRKAVLIPCLGLFALGGFAASFTQNLEVLLFWRILQGIGASSLGVLYATIVGDIYPNDTERLKIMGYAATTLSLGAAIFPALGGLLGEVSWQWTLRLSLIAIPLLFLVLFTPLPPHEKKGNMKKYAQEAKKNILQTKTLLHFAITFCAFYVLYGPLISYFPLLAKEQYNASPMHIGALFAVSSLGTVAVTLYLAPIVQALSQRLVACVGACCFALSMLILLLWPQDIAYGYLAFPILCYGIGQGLLYPLTMSSLTALTPLSSRGAIMAVNGTILRLSQSIAPFMSGFLFLHGTFSFVFMGGLIISSIMLLLAFRAFCAKRAH